WFNDDSISGDQSRYSHAAEDRERKIPRSDNGSVSARQITVNALFAGCLLRQSSLVQAPHFLGVKYAEINSLADIGICLGPILADLEYLPCSKIVPVLSQLCSEKFDQPAAIFSGCLAPVGKAALCGCHRVHHIPGASR